MEIKDVYTREEVFELFEELEDLGVDLNDLALQMTLSELVKMSNRLRS
jgi:hypothetical protein